MDGYDRAAELGKAIGHPTRLQILQVLRDEEACVCHLEAVLGQRQAHISQHLARLRDAGLVVDRREGMNVFYSLAARELGPLVEAALNAAAALAAAAGDELTFEPLAGGAGSECTCPTCQAKMSPYTRVSELSTSG